MSNEIATVSDTNSLIFNPDAMNAMYRMAETMASARSTVPAHLKGSVGDCMAIIIQAAQFRMNPFAVAQKTFLVNGVLGYEAQLVNAVIINNGPVKGRFDYEFIGDWSKVQGKTKQLESKTKTDDSGRPKLFRVPAWTFEDEKGLGVIVRNTIVGEDKPRELTLFMTQALTRNSAQWADDPQQQLSYLAVKKWARRYMPDVILGVYSADELETNDLPEKEINPIQDQPAEMSLEEIIAKIRASTKDDFNDWLDPKRFSTDEKKRIRKEIDLKRNAWKQESVVADIKPELEPALKWLQMLGDAGSEAECRDICAGIPESLYLELINKINDRNLLNRLYLHSPKAMVEKFAEDFDAATSFLKEGE